MVQPPSLLEFPGPLTPPPPWNFQFPPWWGSGYFLESHNPRIFLGEGERYYIAKKYHLKCTVISAVSFSCGPTWAGHDKEAVCG